MVKGKEEKELSLYDKYLEQMKLIQEKTGIPGTYVMGCLIAAIVFVYIGFLERFITNLVGTVYPAFWTMKSIESRTDDDKHWLTYWVVFACFTIIDMFSGFILRFIPFYFFLKICFLIWLFMPNSQGCNIIYHLLVVRVFKSFEQDIDQATGRIGELTKEFVAQGANVLESKAAAKVISGIVSNSVNVSSKNDLSNSKSKSIEKDKKPIFEQKKDVKKKTK